MSDKSTETQVWFLRHGKTPFDYENSKYDDFIEMLCNGHKTRLIKNHEIKFQLLPEQVDLVGYSPARRSVETAQILRDHLVVKKMEKVKSLHEVKFDEDIVLRHEFESLEQIRPEILKRWRQDRNKAESFAASLARVKEIEEFISKRLEKTMILVTHGWFLRLLEIYFVEGNHTPTLDDLLRVKPVPLGHCIKATVQRNSLVELPVRLFEPTV